MTDNLPPAVRMGDTNRPGFAILPIWGPDGQSRRMAIWNFIRGNPFGPSSWGPGIRPAPYGASASENVKSTTYLPAQQQFSGLTRAIADPAIATLRRTGQFPSAGVATNPTFMDFDVDPNAGW
jgi:hypothetical protein